MRMIDADTLNYVRVRIYHDDGTIGGYNAVVPSSEIKNAPTVDAVPVRHGKWVQRFIKIGGQVFKHGMQCSVCAEPALDNEGDDYLTNYCPNCGAKMDGERKEE